MKLFLCVIVAILAYASAEKLRFDNFKLVRLNPQAENHLEILKRFQKNSDFDIWNGIGTINETVDVSLSPDDFKKYKPVFNRIQLPYEIINENIQDLIDEQDRSMRTMKRSNSIVGTYARYSEIINFMETVEANNADLVSHYSAGSTYEKRDLRVMVIKTASSKKDIWIDCGIHAREYISVVACVYFIDKLITNYRANENVAVNLLENYSFHVLPVTNPDGYEYTFTNMRLWRKNRSPNYGSSCIGTDVNRNFAYKWMYSGTSNYPCSDIYGGSKAASELETQAVQNAILANKGNWEAFMTLHAFGGYWMPPWAWGSEVPSDYPELEALSKVAVNAIRNVHGEVFKIGTPYMTLNYAASGGSYDWVKAIAGVKYCYALELRPSSNTADSRYGFMLPVDRAIKAGEETYAGLVSLFEAIRTTQ